MKQKRGYRHEDYNRHNNFLYSDRNIEVQSIYTKGGKTMKIFLFLFLTTAMGAYLINISGVTVKQVILCAIGIALYQPLTNFLIGFIKGLIR